MHNLPVPGDQLCRDCVVESVQDPWRYLCRSSEGRVRVDVVGQEDAPALERLVGAFHPNLQQVWRVEREDGLAYVVQDPVPDSCLEDLLPLPGEVQTPANESWVEEVLVPDLCRGLKVLHDLGILHGGLHTGSCFMRSDERGTVVLADFARTLVSQGTDLPASAPWAWLPPEALGGAAPPPPTPAAEFYALGIVALEMLFGPLPGREDGQEDWRSRWAEGRGPSLPSSVPGRLRIALQGLLHPVPRERWGAAELDRWIAGEEPVPAATDPPRAKQAPRLALLTMSPSKRGSSRLDEASGASDPALASPVLTNLAAPESLLGPNGRGGTLRVEEDPPASPGRGGTRRVEEEPPASPGRGGTLRVEEMSAAPAVGVERHLPLGVLAAGAVLCTDCQVRQTLHPHETERPGLYLCDAPEGPVVVKVAATRYPPEPELWNRLATLSHPHVLRTCRTVVEGGFHFEVQEYCSKGTLADRVPRPGGPGPDLEWLCGTVLPHLAAGLSYLHAHEIVHRDIKPENLYVRESARGEEVLLGDFDISSVLTSSRTSRDTARAAGTWRYTAPEAFPRFVDDRAGGRQARVARAADYYSLGVTLLELMVGTTSLHTCELPDLFDFYLQGNRVEIPTTLPEPIRLLLGGLLIRNRHNRWGAEEVQRWREGRLTDQDRRRIQEDQAYELARASNPYKFPNSQPVDLPGLAEGMARDPEEALEDLLGGEVLMNWIGALDPAVVREIRRVRDKHRSKPDLVLFAAILYCDPARPYRMPDGTEVYTATEWLRAAEAMVLRGETRARALASEDTLTKLEMWLLGKTQPEPPAAEAVRFVRQSAESVRMQELGWALEPDRPYTLSPGVAGRLPGEVARLSLGAGLDWLVGMPEVYRRSFDLWQGGVLYAWMRQRGMADLASRCRAVAEGLQDHSYPAFEMVLRCLDPSLPPLRVEIQRAGGAGEFSVPYGEVHIVEIPYRVEGAGVPLGAFRLESAPSGLGLETPALSERSGVLRFTLDGRTGTSGGGTQVAMLRLQGGYVELEGGGVPLPFRVVAPVAATVLRVTAGMAAGGILLGLPRWIVAMLGMNEAFSFADYSFTGYWSKTMSWGFPGFNYLVATAILGGFGYAAWRVALLAWRKSDA